MFTAYFFAWLCLAVVSTNAQQSGYGQCGGDGYSGPTTCVSGFTCQYQNQWYSQCVPSGSGGGGSTSAPAPTSSTPASPAASQSYSQPIIWQDLADCEVIRVNDTFYYTASTMHYSPGAPILRSYDLVHWEFAGHSVPVLDWSSKYDLTNGQRAYVKGIWASSLRYRKANGLFYWIGCIEFSQSWVYTASRVEGPWTRHGPISNCYYDAGLLIDDKDTMYVSYGSSTINVAQLSSDGFSQVRAQAVYTSPSDIGYIEGSRMYQINGNYYIAVTQPTPGGEYILKSSSGTPWGPYTIKQFVRDVGNPVPGGAGPHQGGIVDTPTGQWFYIGFSDAYPGGRVPVMTPFTWGSDGFPVAQLDGSGKFPTSGTVPLASHSLRSATGTFTFSSPLAPEWEWNHNPDTSKFSISGSALKLSTATVTFDLYSARNTLTRRILGPQSTATIVLDYSGMQNGDRAGLALFRDKSAWIGIKKDNGGARVVFVNGIDMDTTWTTTNTGAEAAAGGSIPATGKIWLRLAADIRPSSSSPQGTFSYSTDGNTFTRVGNGYTMNKDWHYFMGYRFAVFNYGTTALGGSVLVNSFTLSTP